jgi:hypothetical protein
MSSAAQPVPDEPLQTGILEEELNFDLNAAIQSYRSLITHFDSQRPLAANAIFRLGECYRRLGRSDEANAQYARILREFSDQTPLAKLCQKYFPPASRGRISAAPGPDDAELKSELKLSAQSNQDLLEWQLAQVRSELLKAKKGVADGEVFLLNAHEKNKELPTTPNKTEVELAKRQLSLAKEQEVHWSKEVARLEARLKGVQTRQPSREEAGPLESQLQSAQSNLARTQALYDRKFVSQSEYEAAHLAKDLAEAELKGDAVRAAALKLERAERELKRVEALFKQNLISEDEYEKAKLARDVAAAEHSKLAPDSPAQPTPAGEGPRL